MRVAFRTDASLQIGTGHVMRCLTLADSLRQRGAQCSFVCRPHAGNLLELITERGHRTLPLSALEESGQPNANGTAYCDWLGTKWEADAAETSQVLSDSLGSEPLDWLVVDHYALERSWEQEMRPYVRRIMVIDDLADRPHECDLLLDQNLGRTSQDYSDYIPQNALVLTGPQYALMSPEFAQHRAESLERRTKILSPKNILITMGGVDKNNVTGQLLDIIKACALPSDLSITVVMGQHAPWLVQVRGQAAQMPWHTKVLVGVNNMAQLMAYSDLAIGASGGTAWERCCLGLPSLILVLAENQLAGAVALHNSGAAIALRTNQQIREILHRLQYSYENDDMLIKLSQAAARVTDGRGCIRVTDSLIRRNHV